jgi:hypothetical protein
VALWWCAGRLWFSGGDGNAVRTGSLILLALRRKTLANTYANGNADCIGDATCRRMATVSKSLP